jgi:hypothetical protein
LNLVDLFLAKLWLESVVRVADRSSLSRPGSAAFRNCPLMSLGYSKRPLAEKLGIKRGSAIAILNPPADYEATLGDLPEGTTVLTKLKGELDFIQFFTTNKSTLEDALPKLKANAKADAAIWISWPKRSARLETDLNDAAVREIGLRNGLVDVKVCAVDATWSGLKFVRRLRDRPSRPSSKS